MGVIDQLASSLNRRDEVPNQELAKKIAANNDALAIKELVELLANKSTAIQNDSIKVLYEVGAIQPALIAGHAPTFIGFLQHKNNRLQWGAMTALDSIISENPTLIFNALPIIMEAAEKGSVITRDHAVNILIKLGAIKAYSDKAFILLLQQLKVASINQLPMYAERSLHIINKKNKAAFIQTLTARLTEIEKDSKRKRVEKAIEKASKTK